jgi:hypothetical protein
MTTLNILDIRLTNLVRSKDHVENQTKVIEKVPQVTQFISNSSHPSASNENIEGWLQVKLSPLGTLKKIYGLVSFGTIWSEAI